MENERAELIPQLCCDICNDIIHNHMTFCPACKKQFAGTSMYSQAEKNEEFECESCNAKLKVVDYPYIEMI